MKDKDLLEIENKIEISNLLKNLLEELILIRKNTYNIMKNTYEKRKK